MDADHVTLLLDDASWSDRGLVMLKIWFEVLLTNHQHLDELQGALYSLSSKFS